MSYEIHRYSIVDNSAGIGIVFGILLTVVISVLNINKIEIRQMNGETALNNREAPQIVAEGTDREIEKDCMADYYGCYQIKQFCFTENYFAIKYDIMPDQEADMMMGKIIILDPDLLVTYDSERSLGTRGENFGGNYMIEKYVIENPQYEWTGIEEDTLESFLVPDYAMKWAIGDEYYKQLKGIISVPPLAKPYGTQFFYAMNEKDKLIMYSTLTNQYFLLEKCNDNDQEDTEKLSSEECEKLIQNIYGEYTITEFLPTKYYPAIDSSGYEILPEEEVKLMLGKRVLISREFFTAYDNFRLPNSEITNRLEDGYWVEEIEIADPEYHVEKKAYGEIYGIRDNILESELRQQEYMEIDVYPGYETHGERILPQLFLTDDSKVIMYSMGEYFLLEKSLPDQVAIR